MADSALFITILYGLVGSVGALSLVVLAWGFIVYIVRLGTVRREAGIHVMEWGVGLIVTSVILIGILHLMLRWFGP